MEVIILLLKLFFLLLIYFIGKRSILIYRNLVGIRRPEFYFREVGNNQLGIPVFTYHSIAYENTPDSVTPEDFENHIQYLIKNSYKTLSADEYLQYISGETPIPDRVVVITFDDGRASFWTAAFPLIKKYNIKVVCFLVPSFMQQAGIRPFLYDDRQANNESIANIDLGQNFSITWDEAREMHKSGLVDFQSHTLAHQKIFISDEIKNFINPYSKFGVGQYNKPIFKSDFYNNKSIEAIWGTPLYDSDSRMGAGRRYLEDDDLQKYCVDFVYSHGGREFFNNRDWQTELFDLVADYKQQKASFSNKYESQEEQRKSIFTSLLESKKIIENNLPNHEVKHICYPWHRYSSLSLSLAGEAGYKAGWIDLNPQKLVPKSKNNPYLVEQFIPINCKNDDPFFISRIDARNDMILSLPGKGRKTIFDRTVKEFFRLPKFLTG